MNNDWLDNLLHSVNLDPGHLSLDPLPQLSVNPGIESNDLGHLQIIPTERSF